MLYRLRHSGFIRPLLAAWVAAWLGLLAAPCWAAGAPDRPAMPMDHAAPGHDCSHCGAQADNPCAMAAGLDCDLGNTAALTESFSSKSLPHAAPPAVVPSLPAQTGLRQPVAWRATAPPSPIPPQLRYCRFLE